MMDDLDIFSGDLGIRPRGKAAPPSSAAGSHDSDDVDAIFVSSSMPVYDKPLYDDDDDDARGSSAAVDLLQDAFSSPWHTDDLLESLGRLHSKPEEKDAFEDLIPGFGTPPPPQRMSTDINNKHSAKATSLYDDPFVVLETTSSSAYSASGTCTDPFEHICRTMGSESKNTTCSNEGVFDDNAFEILAKLVPSYNASVSDDQKNKSSSQRNIGNNGFGHSARKESPESSTSDHFELLYPKAQNVDDNFEPNGPSTHSSFTQNLTKDGAAQNSDVNVQNSERDATSDMSSGSVDVDDVWLTVSEIALFTHPTTAPPPSRHPPTIISKRHPDVKADYTAPFGLDENDRGSFWQSSQSNHFSGRLSNSMESGISPTVENLWMDFPEIYSNEHIGILPNEKEIKSNSAAAESVAAMEAMDKAEMKFKQASEVIEREHDTESAKLPQIEEQRDPTGAPYVLDDEDKERQEKLEREKKQERVEKEEKRHERERELTLERERGRVRRAVERATREARERAAAEALHRAERAAVEKANAEARLRAERDAVQRASAEARERAATKAGERAIAEARERAERAAVEATKEKFAEATREWATADAWANSSAAQERPSVERAKDVARHRAERAAVERATSEARERALAEARQRAASTSREQQYRNGNDIESFFGMGVRATSAPKQRANSSETLSGTQNPLGVDGVRNTAEAHLRTEWAAVEKANAEARLLVERAASQRTVAEARERAATEARARAALEARERAERAAVEAAKEKFAEAARERAAADAWEKAAAARERASVERAKEVARHRAEKAAVERAASEARERTLAEARARAASTAREQQYRNDNDLESFFGMGVRSTSATKQRANSSETLFGTQNPLGMDGVRKTDGAPSSTIRKASSTTNIDDDLTFLIGALSANEFRGVEVETEERRRSRIERQQRANERAAKALAEKNERDLQAQRDQAERHRIAETVDIEIKRWASGKERNLRALLSTLQYVLWPECGWQPVSLTDLIVAASVKKAYRKATLCIHPDKVQQKGATLQQKYIAEKVFDILKEAWNKFNSEELF